MIAPQQGLSYEDQLVIARRVEVNGFETFFLSDHYQSFPGAAGRPVTDTWTVLAGLARETERIGLGVLVSPVTFRHPGSFAKVVTTVDEMSGGRVEVGVGAGWHEGEHRQLGLPFPSIKERADRLEDQLAILHGLWGEPDGWSFEGTHTSVNDALFWPKPIDLPGRPRTPSGGARPNIIVGGEGTPRGLRIAARWADEFNLTVANADTVHAVYARLDEACRAIGREPTTLARSVEVSLLIGGTDREVSTRTAALIDAVGGRGPGDAWIAERRDNWIIGTPRVVRASINRLAAAGAQRIVLRDLLNDDLDMIDLMGEVLVRR